MSYMSYIRHMMPLFAPRKLKPTEESALYITNTIRTFALSLVGIFTPIFIFQLENKTVLLDDQILNGIVWVLLYYVARHTTFLTSLHVLTNVMFQRLGFRYSILLSQLFLSLWAVILFVSSFNPYLLFLGAIFSGLEMHFYWVPYHIFFIRKLGHHGDHYGREAGILYFLVRSVSAIGPFFGGIMISLFGFNPLFIAAIFLILASAIPIMLELRETTHRAHDGNTIIKNFLLDRKHLHTTIGFVGQGIDDIIYVVFWPILLFILLDEFTEIGFLSGITLFASSLMALAVGKFVAKFGSKKVHSWGSLSVAVFHLLRLFLMNPFTIYIVDLLDKMVSSFYSLPILSKTYDIAQGHDDSDFIIYREYALHGAIIVILLLSIGFVTLFGHWKYLFIFSAIGALLTRSLFVKLG